MSTKLFRLTVITEITTFASLMIFRIIDCLFFKGEIMYPGGHANGWTLAIWISGSSR